MKRVLAVILAAGMFLPLIAAPLSCNSTVDKQTLLSAIVKPECLAKYGGAAGL
jgi:hypothetical protein